MPYSLAENVKFETCFDVKTLIPVYFVKAFMLTFDIIKLIVTKFAFCFCFKIYETEMKCCYGTDAYGEEEVSNYPKPYDISIYLRCWVYSVGRYISTSHPNPKISKRKLRFVYPKKKCAMRHFIHKRPTYPLLHYFGLLPV